MPLSSMPVLLPTLPRVSDEPPGVPALAQEWAERVGRDRGVDVLQLHDGDHGHAQFRAREDLFGRAMRGAAGDLPTAWAVHRNDLIEVLAFVEVGQGKLVGAEQGSEQFVAALGIGFDALLQSEDARPHAAVGQFLGVDQDVPLQERRGVVDEVGDLHVAGFEHEGRCRRGFGRRRGHLARGGLRHAMGIRAETRNNESRQRVAFRISDSFEGH